MGLQHPDHRFKSDRRLELLFYGAMVKRLRHHPFTVVSRVRFTLASWNRLLSKAIFYLYTFNRRVIMMTGKTRKIAAIIAIVLVVAMILGMCLVYFHI